MVRCSRSMTFSGICASWWIVGWEPLKSRSGSGVWTHGVAGKAFALGDRDQIALWTRLSQLSLQLNTVRCIVLLVRLRRSPRYPGNQWPPESTVSAGRAARSIRCSARSWRQDRSSVHELPNALEVCTVGPMISMLGP